MNPRPGILTAFALASNKVNTKPADKINAMPRTAYGEKREEKRNSER